MSKDVELWQAGKLMHGELTPISYRVYEKGVIALSDYEMIMFILAILTLVVIQAKK